MRAADLLLARRRAAGRGSPSPPPRVMRPSGPRLISDSPRAMSSRQSGACDRGRPRRAAPTGDRYARQSCQSSARSAALRSRCRGRRNSPLRTRPCIRRCRGRAPSRGGPSRCARSVPASVAHRRRRRPMGHRARPRAATTRTCRAAARWARQPAHEQHAGGEQGRPSRRRCCMRRATLAGLARETCASRSAPVRARPIRG